LKGKFWIVFALGMSTSIVSLPLFAHHGNAAYDTEKRVTVKGTVTHWAWSNPHCVLQLDMKDDSGQPVHWVLETENPSSMVNAGWTREAIKVGDQISATVLPVKNGRPVGRIIQILLPNGQKLDGPHFFAADPVIGPAKQENAPKQ
jgi:hypothetical protein